MKKYTLCLLALLLVACSQPKVEVIRVPDDKPSVGTMKRDERTKDATAEEQKPVENMDLTGANAQVAFAAIADMCMNPARYEGARVSLVGRLMHAPNDASRKAVIVSDSAGCCRQGLEFVSDFDAEENAEIRVTGTLTIYEEDGKQYMELRDTDVTLAE